MDNKDIGYEIVVKRPGERNEVYFTNSDKGIVGSYILDYGESPSSGLWMCETEFGKIDGELEEGKIVKIILIDEGIKKLEILGVKKIDLEKIIEGF